MIDLHIHTTNSDGKYTVKELLQMAEEKGINTISFCDHNVLDAYIELKDINVKEYYSGHIITGIEVDFAYNKKDFHMLGYNFNVDILNNANFIDRRTEQELINIEKERLDFFKSVCDKLNIKLSPDLKIQNLSQPANEIIKADMQKHAENNEILDVLLGKDREKSFYRGHVTNPDSPFFIDFTQDLPAPKEVADTIHNAGGIVVLPHVFEYKSVDNIKFINEIYSMGIIDGIECVHTRHNEKQVKYLENFCKEKGLIMSGGSDFHLEQKQTLGYTSLGPIDDKYCLKRF